MAKGRKPRIWTDEDRAKIKDLAGKGLTHEQIAHCMGISPGKWHAHKAKDPSLAEAVNIGRASAIKDVANALYENAMKGNVTAQIFFLKNRSPDEWKDRKENVHTGVDGGPIQLTDVERTAKLAELLNAARERASRPVTH